MKKKILGMAVLAGSLTLMTACGSSKKVAQTVSLEGEWNIVAVAGEPIKAEEKPYIGLDMAAGRLYGNAGCNRVMGGFEKDTKEPGTIHFTQVATTRMMCTDMQTEVKVLAALNEAKGYVATKTGMDLTDEKGKVLMSLEKREAQAAALAGLAGEWTITAVRGEAIEKLEKTPFLAFDVDQKRVHGNAGCNIVNGGFEQEEGKANSIKFSQMMSTMMAGPGMETESKVLKAVGEVRSFVLKEGNKLALLNADGTEVLTLVKKLH